MTIFASLATFLLPMLLGILLVNRAWKEQGLMALFFKFCLGSGLGLGLNSLIYFICLLIGCKHQILLISQMGLLVLLLLIEFKDVHTKKNHLAWNWPTPDPSRIKIILICGAAAAILLGSLIFLNLTSARPQGARDAWSIWNRAARFIYRDPDNWSATLDPNLFWVTHPDYPLLVPLNVAWGWDVLNKETDRIPILQSFIFIFGTIGLLFAAVGLARTIGQASIATVVFISAPILFDYGYGQISDIPLSFFILATCTTIYLYFRYESPVLLLLSGFSAGLAAWTKNEGVLFVGAGLLGMLLLFKSRNILKPLIQWLAGLAFPLAIVIYFKLGLAPANDIFAVTDYSLLEKITDPARYLLIINYFLQALAAFPGIFINIFIHLGIYAFIVKFDYLTWSRLGNKILLCILGAQLLGYCLIYLVTPHDLEWHLYYSFNRLLFHIYPAGLFLFFSVINEPEKIYSNRLSSGHQSLKNNNGKI